jgi:hypothetical protein
MLRLFLLLLTTLFLWADVEPNDNCNQAELVQLNSTMAGSVQGNSWFITNDPNDYYHFTIPTSGEVKIEVQSNGPINGYLYNSSCSSTVSSRTNSNNFTLTAKVNAGQYKFRLYNDVSTTRTYSFSINYTPDMPSFSINDISFNEGNSGWHTEKVAVSLSNALEETVTVNYATSDLEAKAGIDYKATSGTLTFYPGDITRTILVEINGDTETENNERFKITLSNPSLGTKLDNSSATITIIDDDGGEVYNNERGFLIRNPVDSRNIRGGLRVIGNTVLCPKDRSGKCIESTGSTTNADLDLKFVNTKNFNGSFKNSSDAKLDIPSSATIKWAGFYAQGYLSDSAYRTSNINSTKTAILDSPVRLTIPSLGTIDIPAQITNAQRNGSFGYTYGSYSEVSELKGKKGSEINGWVTAANIKANQGRTQDFRDGLGNFGAWTLVVVYEDQNESLKNISVFDGYRQVNQNNGSVDIIIDGFLTPTSGDVTSTLSIFAGEGDKHISGDKLFIDGVEISVERNNAFNSSISNVERNPSLINNQGIDIQNHDVSNIVKNRQTKSTINLTSTQDAYFPSVVAFTTELYEPRVCYAQTLYDESGENELTSAKIGDIITIHTWISNMKKDATDGDLETADKVLITVDLDEENIEYQDGTIEIKNIGSSTYEQNSNKISFVEDKPTTLWRVGIGANEVDGGRLDPNPHGTEDKKVFVTYKAKLISSGEVDIGNIYKVSYENSLLGERFGDESPLNIGICADFSSSLTIEGALGAFNVVNQNFNKNSNSTDTNSEENALYTQVTGQDFKVKVLSLEDDLKTLRNTNEIVEIGFIDTPDYGSANTTEEKQQMCEDASLLSGTLKTIKFENESSKEITFSYPKAAKSLSFKISFNKGGVTKYACSRDPWGFAVRPSSYELSTPDSEPLTGGKKHTLNIKAMDKKEGGDKSTSYNQTGSLITGTMKVITPAGCDEDSIDTEDKDITFINSFSDGELNYTNFSFDNVGVARVEILDDKWTKVDQKESSGKSFDECIVDSSSDTPNKDGKVGCNIYQTKDFKFIPDRFENRLKLNYFNDAEFAYIGGGEDFSPRLFLTTKAILANDEVATNYTKGCYAKDIDFKISLDAAPQDWVNTGTAKEKILFFDDNATTDISNQNNGWVTASSKEDMFINGIANDLLIKFNFEKNNETPQNPFVVKVGDFKVDDVEDEDNVSGNNFTEDAGNEDINFYYGRVHSPDYRGTSPITAKVGYEVYCKNCDKTTHSISNKQSPTTPFWFINTKHDKLEHGKVKSVASQSSKTTSNPAVSININNGIEDLTLTTNTVPSKDKIILEPDSWLIYNTFNPNTNFTDFLVEFTTGGEWAGEGSVNKENEGEKEGEHVGKNDNNNRTNRRISW